MVSFAVASSLPPTTSTTLSSTTCRCALRMVFVKLFEFFADFYNRRRRDRYAKLAGLLG